MTTSKSYCDGVIRVAPEISTTMETTKELLGIARLKIHPGKREELNPALSPALLPEQPPGKQTRRFARELRAV